MTAYTDSNRTMEQEELYKRVIEASHTAHQLFDEYKRKYGTDKQGISKVIKMLNGGSV